MGLQTYKESAPHSGRWGFTLIEIVVALTIIAVIAAVAIPTMKGLNQEEAASAPLRHLEEMVQEVRDRAMHERRAYQIVFEREAVHACESSFPIARRTEFLKHLEELRTPPKKDDVLREEILRTDVSREEFASSVGPTAAAGRALRPKAPPPPEVPAVVLPWTRTISLPSKTECAVLLWGDGEWDVLEGEKIRRWVFQPTGMANPARVRLRLGTTEQECLFDPLTGQIRSHRSGPRTTET